MRQTAIAVVGLLAALALLLVLRSGADEETGEPRPAGSTDPASEPPRLGGSRGTAGGDAATEAPAGPPIGGVTWPVAVLGPEGRPLVGARVRIGRTSFSAFSGGTVIEVEAVTDVRGVARIPRRGANLEVPPPDAERASDAVRFLVEVLPPADRPDVAPLAREVWPLEVDALRLPAGGPIAGLVEGLDGRGLADVIVCLDGNRRPVARTDEHGAFRIGQLPLGEHVLRLEAHGLPDLNARSWITTTGTTDLRLVVEAGASLRVHVEGWERKRDGHRLRIARSDRADAPPSPPLEVDFDRVALTVHGLEAEGTYTVHLDAGSAGRVGWAPHVPGEVGTLRLPLRDAHAVAGRLELPSGIRGHTIRIQAWVAGLGLLGGVRRQDDGSWRWRVEDLPVAAVRVVAWSGDRETPAARGTLLTTGSGPQVLHVARVR